jgi:hypothetical protein
MGWERQHVGNHNCLFRMRSTVRRGIPRLRIREAAPAHTLGNSTEVAYARSDLFDRRRQLMDEWTGYLATNAVR